jgi:hypothetical protein
MASSWHTHTRAHTHTHTHKYTMSLFLSYTYTDTHTNALLHYLFLSSLSLSHTHTHKQTLTLSPCISLTHTHTHTHIHTHTVPLSVTHTHTYIHTHTHTVPLSVSHTHTHTHPYTYCHLWWGSVSNKTTWVTIGTDLFTSGEIKTTQITITKNTWCTRSGVFYGVRPWSSFWFAGLCVSSGVLSGLIWSDSSVRSFVLIWSDLICVECFFWQTNSGTLLLADPRGNARYPYTTVSPETSSLVTTPNTLQHTIYIYSLSLSHPLSHTL